MPLPLNITWLQVSTGVDTLEIRDETNHLAYTIPLIDYHREILARPTLENGPAGYQLRRSALIQERLFELYISSIRSGVSNTGCFYGVIQYRGVWNELDTIRFEGRLIHLINSEPQPYHRIGLLYAPNPIIPEPAFIDGLGLLPRFVLETLQDRSAHDYLELGMPEYLPIEPPLEVGGLIQPTKPPVVTRRSRYLREPVI